MVLPLRIILHLSHLGFTDARTLMLLLHCATMDTALGAAPACTGYLNRYVILPRERS